MSAIVTSHRVAILQDIRPRQSSLRVAAGKNRLQVHLQQAVHGGRLSDVASPQSGEINAAIHTHNDSVCSCAQFSVLIDLKLFKLLLDFSQYNHYLNTYIIYYRMLV